MDLTTATPVEIDTVLADLYADQNAIGNAIRGHIDGLMHRAGAKRTYGRGNGGWTMTGAEAEAKVREMLANGEVKSWDVDSYTKTLGDLDAAREALRDNHAEQARIGAEFTRRGGWTRAFLVTDGHVHSSMNCSTCNNGEYATNFTWLVNFSGGTEADVVAAAADRACTVCYPTAPVETAGPSTLMTPDERTRAEQRDEAAKAKAERLARKIAKGLTADGSEFEVSYEEKNARQSRYDRETRQHVYFTGDRVRIERFKTEQAATQWLVQYSIWDGDRGVTEKAPAFAAIIEAIATKHGKTIEQVKIEVNAKIAAKRKRDAR